MQERVVFGYQTPVLRRGVPVIVALAMALGGLLTFDSLHRGHPPLVVSLLFDVVVLWMAYQFLWNIGHTIEVDGDSVMWWSVLRRRRVRLADLERNDTLWLGFDRLRVRGQRPLCLAPNDGTWLTFLERLDGAHAGGTFEPTRTDRILANRFFVSTHDGFTERVVTDSSN